MKKQRKQFLILAVTLLIVVGAYFGVGKYVTYVDNKAAEEELLSKTYITELEVDSVEALTFEYSGESNSFVKEDGIWVYEEDKTLNIKQEKIDTMAAAYAKLEIESKIEGVADLAQYGLEEPSRTLSFTADGVEHVWHVGNMNELTGVYYMYDAADSSTVYTIASDFLSNFSYGIAGLVEEEEVSETVETETVETSSNEIAE